MTCLAGRDLRAAQGRQKAERGKEAKMNREDEATEPFEFIVGLPGAWLHPLLRNGGDLDRRIGIAVRAYIRRWKAKNPGVDLPSESLAGRLSNFQAGRQGHTIVDVVWKPPEDIRAELAWDDGTASHIRTAVFEDLGGHDKSSGMAPPAPRPPLEIDIPTELLKKLKGLPGKLDSHFIKALQQYRSKWNRESNHELPPDYRGQGDMLTPAEMGGVTEVRWQVPEGLSSVTPREVRAALRAYVRGFGGLWTAVQRLTFAFSSEAEEKEARRRAISWGTPPIGGLVKLKDRYGAFRDPETGFTLGRGTTKRLEEPIGALTMDKIKFGGIVKADEEEPAKGAKSV
jgi:hypothetical protein